MNSKSKFLMMPCWITAAQIRSDDTIDIDSAVEGNLYLVGGTVTVNAPVHGDLVVVAGTLLINDSISEDLIAAAGKIVINGPIGDDLRAAGASVTLEKDVSGDVLMTGGELYVKKGVSVGGDFFCSGGTVIVDGNIARKFQNASSELVFNGEAGELATRSGKISVDGTVHHSSEISAAEIVLEHNARFEGVVRYWRKHGPLDFSNYAGGNQAKFDPSLKIEGGRWYYLGFASALLVVWYLSTVFLLILALQYLFPKLFRNTADEVFSSAPRALGTGVLFMIALPVAIVFATLTIIGVSIALLLMVVFMVLVLLMSIVISVSISNWLNKVYFNYAWGSMRMVFAAMGIFVVLKLIMLTPLVGPLTIFLLAALTLGGIILHLVHLWRERRVAAVHVDSSN